MRRLLSLFFAVALLVIACSKPEPDNPNPTPETPKQETVTLSPGTNTAPVITTAGGSVNVSFTASAAWSASIINAKADSWCGVSPTSGVAGAASITITVKENTTPDNRSASVVIKSGTATQTIKVEQKQKDALTVTASSFEVSADGGEIKVATKSNVSFTHSISTDAQSWIKAVETKALKDSTLTFEIDVNKEVAKRSGQIYLASGNLKDTVNVYQAGETPTIVVSQDEYVLKSEGESFEVEVASNVNANVSMVFPQGVDAWISENTSRTVSTNKFYFTAQANETYDSRSALIIFSNTETNLADTVTVNQAQKDAIVVAKSSYNVENEGGAIEIEVGHNVDYEYTISADWITKADTKAMVTDKLVFNVAENTSYDNREGTITFTSGSLKQEVKVYQSEKGALIISKTDHVLNSDGGEITLEIQANVEFSVTEPTVDWLHKVSTKGLQTHTLKYTVDPNEGYDSRSTQLQVKNLKTGAEETLTITQTQKDAIVVAKSSYNVENDGGAIEIEVGHNVDYEYTISSDWITKAETKALVTDKLVFNVAENTSYDNREGTITFISGSLKQEVKVYQSEKGALIISKTDHVLNSDGGEITLEIQANVEFTVSEPSVDWLHNTTTKGLQTHTLKYTVDAYEGYESRTTQLYVTNTKTNSQDTLTITQLQKDAIVLAKSEYEFDKEGGNLDFEIQTNVDVTVSIAEDCKSWITQVETRALETKKLFFNVAACDTLTVDRTGVITISGGDITQTVKITQSNIKEILAAEREALIAFYNSTGGDNWTNNNNWCSDKPVSEWYGVYCNSNGYVTWLNLRNNNLMGFITPDIIKLQNLEYLELPVNRLTGTIPKEIGSLKNLISLNLNSTELTGEIPSELGNLSELRSLSLQQNKLSGNIPKEIGNLKNLGNLSLGLNDLSGEIPKEIGNLKKLTFLGIQYCSISGTIPQEIGNLEELEYLYITDTKISGNIPAEIGNLNRLKELCLRNNKLTGNIPESIGNLMNLNLLRLECNNLTGKVPVSLMQHPIWERYWHYVITQSENCEGLSPDGLIIELPNFSVQGIEGDIITDEDVKKNKYSILYGFFTDCPFSNSFTPELVSVYERYKDNGVNIYSPVHKRFSKEELQEYIDKYDINWPVFRTEESGVFFSYLLFSPSVTVYDSTGKMIFFPTSPCKWQELISFMDDLLGLQEDVYESSDYSSDGKVVELQKATMGEGIDVVMMGDGYSDRMVADGTYDQIMNSAMEKLFTEEPYKTFRNHFNVYYVTAVSKNEVYSDCTTTAFAGYFGDKSNVGGNDSAVFEYATKAIGEDRLDNALLIVLMNSVKNNAGTCYMYQSTIGDYGNGVSVSYFPVGNNGADLEQVLHHEACGHGFAKLGDEYAYEDLGQIPSDEVESHKVLEQYGWWKNIDFTNDPSKVKWAKFLSDTRYGNEGLGVFEGGATYWKGVWRPTENSIMRYNTGGFNAPSREAIYYRIHKLAYGADWQYDYEKFVEWDAINRKSEAQTKSMPLVLDPEKGKLPHTPPVVIPHSWREAK